ncbi:MAG: glycine--tRNA ligase subunit beta [Desulfofustis sp.]|nr:glycine--tRNA ligase subunit beta [Desulfofustis sp.]
MAELLFEIGTEELPAGFIRPAMADLKRLFVSRMKELGVPFEQIRAFGTPRRLALVVTGIVERQDDRQEVLLGPSRQAAFDDAGTPTRAAQGFARSRGVSVDDLELVSTPKGEYLQLTRTVAGKRTSELLPVALKEMILELSFAKSMRWGANQYSFARPIQWLTALFDGAVVELEHEGIVSSNRTRGHRFLAPDFVEVAGAARYEDTLESIQVIGDFEARRSRVLAEIEAAVGQTDFGAAARVSVDEELLDTVTNLIEYPFGVCGRFDEKFLEVPDTVLITSMREHQKYFPVVAEDGSLLPGFVAVNNTRVLNPELTREGHERVLRARLEDALFFYESDKKRRLEERIDDLEGVIFQARLGSVKDKSERVVKLTRLLAESLEPDLVETACRAAALCKADLTTNMVGEFPSLQGEMGSAYASHDGEDDLVAAGIREHYLPLRSGSELPATPVGALVGMADRIDTIAGCFGIGQTATGTTDPFGLRRLSLAFLNILTDRSYRVDMPSLFGKALALYGGRVDGSARTVEQIVSFVQGRFVNDCARLGMDPGAVDAAVSVQFVDVIDCLKRIGALIEAKKDQSFAMLAGSFKRIRNIIKDHDEIDVREDLLGDDAERSLYEVYRQLRRSGSEKLGGDDYRGFLDDMLQLKEPVDRFFDEVMVMVEDQAVRRNRLNLLTAINQLILQVGDISKMHRE